MTDMGDRKTSRGRRAGAVRAWRAAAEKGLARVAAGGATDYDRRRTLPRLIGLDPCDLAEPGRDVGRAIRARLVRALRAERRRGRAGHWAYDLNRHVALIQALAGEEEMAKARASPSPCRSTAPAPG